MCACNSCMRTGTSKWYPHIFRSLQITRLDRHGRWVYVVEMMNYACIDKIISGRDS